MPQFNYWRKIMKNRLLTLAGALALFAVLGKFYAAPALAQVVRAAVVKNLDERGRNPYMQTTFLSCTAANGLCDLFFPAVPAGKRLVVEHVSANVYAASGINATFLLTPGNAQFALAARANSSPTLLAVNEPVLAYFDAGQSPLYRVALNVAGSQSSISAVISGYLVDLTQ
jgi:hypothetical protein